MKKFLVIIMGVILFSASPAAALFTNGGFETGDTTGWDINGDHNVISSFTSQFNPTTWDSGIPYYGDYSLLLGSPAIGNEFDDKHQSSATQTGAISQADVDAGLHLFFKWGALLEEPTNNVTHNPPDQPYFSVEVSSSEDGNTWTSRYFEDQRADQTGFTPVGTNATGDDGDIWYGTDIADINLLTWGLGLGDQVKIDLFVRDCGLDGHGGLVFLDGFGTTRPTDPVPEPATMLLLGTGLMGLAGFGRKKFFKKL